MKLMVDGTWRGEVPPTPELAAQRMIHVGRFRDRITSDGSFKYPAQAGRYHLYVSPACPFSHRVMVVRTLKRLETIVGVSVLHPALGHAGGRIFGDTCLSTVDGAGNGKGKTSQNQIEALPAFHTVISRSVPLVPSVQSRSGR